MCWSSADVKLVADGGSDALYNYDPKNQKPYSCLLKSKNGGICKKEYTTKQILREHQLHASDEHDSSEKRE